MDDWTLRFLVLTVATSVTGFGFPFTGVTPAQILGVLSLGALGLAIYGRYSRGMAGGWRWGYIIGAVVALYFNVFVLIVQSFQKIPMLRALAPTQSEPPFQVAQLTALLFFAFLGITAIFRFHPPSARIGAVVSSPRRVTL
jgi:hypothetical protein